MFLELLPDATGLRVLALGCGACPAKVGCGTTTANPPAGRLTTIFMKVRARSAGLWRVYANTTAPVRPCWTGCSSPAYASSASLSRRPAPSGSSAVHTSASTSGDDVSARTGNATRIVADLGLINFALFKGRVYRLQRV